MLGGGGVIKEAMGVDTNGRHLTVHMIEPGNANSFFSQEIKYILSK